MWTKIEIASSDNRITFGIREKGSRINHHRFLDLLKNSSSFRNFYSQQLAACDFEAFLWENKPITKNNIDQDYECTLIDNHYLAGCSPDPHTFGQYFQSDKPAVCFPNLGGDAQLIAPCPRKTPDCYTHLASFVREADSQQQEALWRMAAQTMHHAINEQPRWLSTNGLGVSWLHLRIDRQPKYYRTESYKTLC